MHTENIEKAIDIMFSSNAKGLVKFWFISIIGIAMQLSAFVIMLKITGESIKYSYYEYNVGIHIILTIFVFGISVATILYALKAIIGVFLIAVIAICLLYLGGKKKY